MYTEEEAKEKWCPMAIWLKVDNRFYNTRKTDTDGFEGCIASDCIMWKWEDDINPETARLLDMEPKDCEGYCGLSR